MNTSAMLDGLGALQRQVDVMVLNQDGPDSLFFRTDDDRRYDYRALIVTMNDSGLELPGIVAGALAAALGTTVESPIVEDKTLYWRQRPQFELEADGTYTLTCRYAIVDGRHEIKA